jgi:hypothetical protein
MEAALYFLDRNQMALLARFLLGTEFPEAVRRRLDSDYAINRARLTRIREMYAEAARALTARGLDWTLLKGSAGVDEYYADPDSRVQYDLDLYCPLTPQRAQEALLELGYHPSAEASPSADHLPPLARETGWTWQGDFFDPSIPIAIEVNFRLWDEQTERIAAPGVEKFWERRRGDVLDPADALAHKALICCGICCEANFAPRIYTRLPGSCITTPRRTRSGSAGTNCTSPACDGWKLSRLVWRRCGLGREWRLLFNRKSSGYRRA